MAQQETQPQNDAQALVQQQKTQDDGQEHANKWALFSIVAIGVFIQNHSGNLSALQQTFTTNFRTALLVCAGIAAIGVFTSLVRGGGGKKKA